MTDLNITKRVNRMRRHDRVRAKVSGTADRPRISVFKSNQHVIVQAVDDVAHVTIASATDAMTKKGTKTERASATGTALAKLLVAKKIKHAVFDVGGFKYHGRLNAVADGVREGGVKI